MTFWSIVLVAVVQVILGSLWYGPLFGESWMKMVGIRKPSSITTQMRNRMIFSYFIVFVGSLLMAFVLKMVLLQFPFATVRGVSFVALLMWIGFIAQTQLGTVLWEGKPFKLYLINSGYYLVSLVISAIILLKNWI